jgi:hypothetical protein
MPDHYETLLTKFFERLHGRGHSIENLTSLFSQAAASLDTAFKHHRKTEDEEETLFIHWSYHPRGLQRSDIRQIFNETLQPHLPYKKVTIAISHPKNLREVLTRTALSLPDDCTVQNEFIFLTANHTAGDVITLQEQPYTKLLNEHSKKVPLKNGT